MGMLFRWKIRNILGPILIVCLGSIAQATPIKPRLEDLVKQENRPQINFPAARAGWNGPQQKANSPEPNLLLEQYGPAGTVRAAQASILSVAQPDPRAFFAIGLIILLLRILRGRNEREKQRQATSNAGFSNQPDTALEELKAA